MNGNKFKNQENISLNLISLLIGCLDYLTGFGDSLFPFLLCLSDCRLPSVYLAVKNVNFDVQIVCLAISVKNPF